MALLSYFFQARAVASVVGVVGVVRVCGAPIMRLSGTRCGGCGEGVRVNPSGGNRRDARASPLLSRRWLHCTSVAQ